MQRWGRTERTRDGVAYCFYTRGQHQQMKYAPDSAVHRDSFTTLALSLFRLKNIPDFTNLDLIERPTTKRILIGLVRLIRAGFTRISR